MPADQPALMDPYMEESSAFTDALHNKTMPASPACSMLTPAGHATDGPCGKNKQICYNVRMQNGSCLVLTNVLALIRSFIHFRVVGPIMTM